MHPRHLADALVTALKDTPAVLLVGGRQTGKTTLAQAVAAGPHPSRYFTLDDATLRGAAQADPAAFLADLEGPLVLDEVQQAPSLFPALRREIDRDRRPGRFLLTGSAKLLTTPLLADALVGRMERLRLWPLSQGELSGVREGFIDAVYESRLPPASYAGLDRDEIWKRALTGGFPEAVQRTAARRSGWLRSYIDLLLQRDVRDLAAIDQLDAVPRLLELVAARVGSLLNYSELSRSAGLPQTTLKRYFALLEGVFLVFRLQAWAKGTAKRLTRSPKLHLADAALLAHLAGLTPAGLHARPDLGGALVENFVAVELAKQLGWCRSSCRLYHFRTSIGREVDFVLEDDRGRVVGLEVKSAASVDARDFRGLDALSEAAGSRFHRGIVLYAGCERVAFGERYHALPIEALWKLCASPVRDPLPPPR